MPRGEDLESARGIRLRWWTKYSAGAALESRTDARRPVREPRTRQLRQECESVKEATRTRRRRGPRPRYASNSTAQLGSWGHGRVESNTAAQTRSPTTMVRAALEAGPHGTSELLDRRSSLLPRHRSNCRKCLIQRHPWSTGKVVSVTEACRTRKCGLFRLPAQDPRAGARRLPPSLTNSQPGGPHLPVLAGPDDRRSAGMPMGSAW